MCFVCGVVYRVVDQIIRGDDTSLFRETASSEQINRDDCLKCIIIVDVFEPASNIHRTYQRTSKVY